MATPVPHIVFDPGDRAARKVVDDGLTHHNLSATGFDNYAPIAFFLKSATGDVHGGLHGFVWGGWMFIHMFWLAEPWRRGGHGRRLLRAAEALARERRCVGVYLDTFSFQARPFYEKEGYTVYGTLEDCPVGHAHYFLAKRFDGRPVVAAKPPARRPRRKPAARKRAPARRARAPARR